MSYKVNFQNQTRKKKKYGNKSKVYTTSLYGTRTFDSIKEANYCEELDWLLKAGEISHYDLQYKIDLRGLQDKHVCNYYVDFRVLLPDGSTEYHEVKGFETRLWQLKWKLTEQQLAKDEPYSTLIVVK